MKITKWTICSLAFTVVLLTSYSLKAQPRHHHDRDHHHGLNTVLDIINTASNVANAIKMAPEVVVQSAPVATPPPVIVTQPGIPPAQSSAAVQPPVQLAPVVVQPSVIVTHPVVAPAQPIIVGPHPVKPVPPVVMHHSRHHESIRRLPHAPDVVFSHQSIDARSPRPVVVKSSSPANDGSNHPNRGRYNGSASNRITHKTDEGRVVFKRSNNNSTSISGTLHNSVNIQDDRTSVAEIYDKTRPLSEKDKVASPSNIHVIIDHGGNDIINNKAK